MLTEEHKKLPIVTDSTFLSLVSRTGNFIPTPTASQLIVNVKRSLHVLCGRIHSALSQKVYHQLISSGKTASAAIGIPDWKPKVFQFTNERLEENSRFYFSNDNPVWRAVRGEYPELPSTFNTFRTDALRKAEAISNALKGCKWRNLPAGERKILAEVRSLYPQLHVGKADKNLGPVIASRSMYVDALKRTLRDSANTYKELVGATTDKILQKMDVDFKTATAKFQAMECFKGLFHTLQKWHKNCLLQPHLCPIYLLWKIHKPGWEVRPIVPNKGYYTCQLSQFLHCVLAPAVFRNEHVLKDALTLIRRMDRMQTGSNLRVTTFDVTALYPSIDLERGLNSLRWFLQTFCVEYQDKTFKDLIMVFARFVLTNCFISCPEVSENPFLQLIGTAMGTTFAVVYANVHMIFIEWNIVYSFKQCIQLYNRFLDDGICFWIGSDDEFKAFSQALGTVDPSIRMIWTKLTLRAIYLDLSLEISQNTVQYEVYSKPGNSFAFLPMGSFHVRKTFPEFIKTCLYRGLTHSSDYHRWVPYCQLLYTKLRRRGYGDSFLNAVFAKVTWGDRLRLLSPVQKQAREFDLRCVWSCANAVGIRELFASCDLNLAVIDNKLFPAKINKVVKGAKRLSAYM